MLTSQHRMLIVEAAAVISPLVLVYFGRGLLSGPPPASSVVPVNANILPAIPAHKPKPLSAEQTKATEWVRALPPTGGLTSPLNHPVAPVVVAAPQTESEPAPPPPVVAPPSPIKGLKLTAVVGNDSERLASINGKIYRLGQWVRPGLKLSEIDARNSKIVLTDSTGANYELKREQK